VVDVGSLHAAAGAVDYLHPGKSATEPAMFSELTACAEAKVNMCSICSMLGWKLTVARG